MDIYRAKGAVKYYYSGGEMIDVYREYKPWEIEMNIDEYRIYDLIEGKAFLEDVRAGLFIDYDGVISDVFIDGYVSNLGLFCNGICQGCFMLSENDWEEMCNKHKIEVNWANK